MAQPDVLYEYRWPKSRAIRWVLMALMAFSSPGADAQTPLDSLWQVWNNPEASDTARFKALHGYVGKKFQTMPDSAIFFGRILYEKAQRKGAKKYMGQALVLQGRALGTKGEVVRSGECFEEAAALFRSIGDTRDLAIALNNLGNNDVRRGDLAHAIEHMTQSLRVAEGRKDSSMIARLLGNIGVVYDYQDDTANAVSYYKQRIRIAEAIGQKDILGEAILNIAAIQHRGKDYKSAVEGFEKALELSREIGYQRLEHNCLYSLGSVRTDMGDLPIAMDLMQQALQLSEEIDDQSGVAAAQRGIAEIHLATGDLSNALRWGERALAIARSTGDVPMLQDAASLLYRAHKDMGHGRDALAMHELYVEMRDSVVSDANKQEIMSQRFQYDYDKKEALLIAEQEKKDAVAAEELRRKNLQRNTFIGGFVLMILLAGVFFFQRNRISKEKARSEELLLNILPEEVAKELKAKGSAEAVHIDQVTVLFTDFKGFTAMSEVLTPQQLVRDLNECFSAFDHITAKHGIEKIKTIGDAYMAAGGLPTPNTTHAADVINAALEMRDFIAEGKARKIAAGLPYFEIRIGIHTGPVVAGIVGVKKFSYDIWGDTVNTASRMESSGEVGQVNISEATYELVKSESGLAFTPRGKVQAKGKGEMEMYFVERSKPPMA